MGRANNTARSLQIISRANGWDPNKIEDVGNGPGHPGSINPDLEASYFAREDPFSGDTTKMKPLPGDVADAQASRPDVSQGTKPSFHTPELRENEDHGHAESFSRYKPGAGKQ
jgi:hypothetical protein